MAEPWTLGPVLVTGGTGQIGLAIARSFLAAGAAVAVVGSTTERTQAAAAALPGGHAYRFDVAEPAQIDAMLDAVERALGTVAVLVNGAGINFNRGLDAIAESDYDRVMAVNVKSAFFASRAACRRMVAQGVAGRVINITSGNYRYARPDAALYCASKAALEMLTRSFALEYGAHGITVNAVAPGLIERPGTTDPNFLRVADYYLAHTTQRRLVTTDDVAAAVMYLASERAAAIAGETIVIDGGYSAGRLDFRAAPSDRS